ncbi:hypothetical protein ACOMHN_002129 [Nucella lapillus]
MESPDPQHERLGLPLPGYARPRSSPGDQNEQTTSSRVVGDNKPDGASVSTSQSGLTDKRPGTPEEHHACPLKHLRPRLPSLILETSAEHDLKEIDDSAAARESPQIHTIPGVVCESLSFGSSSSPHKKLSSATLSQSVSSTKKGTLPVCFRSGDFGLTMSEASHTRSSRHTMCRSTAHDWREMSVGHGPKASQDVSEEHGWTQELQGEYVVFNQILAHRQQRRRTYIQGCVLAPVLFNLFFTYVLSYAVRDIEDGVYIRSREKESHLKTFADIGDEATKGTSDAEKTQGFTLFDIPFKSKKSETGNILCDLQCFPSFCTYPLAVQNKIARCGMFMPVDKRRIIVRQGHEAQNWYFVLSGQAIETETICNEDGTQTQNTVKFITQGMTFAEDPILQGTPQPYTVTARKNMQLIRMKKKHYIEVCHRISQHADDIPEHIQYLKRQPFMASFPYEVLLKHPFMCCQYYCRPNTVLVADSASSDWIYLIRSGSCVVQMYVESTKASWRDLELALSHPQVNVNGLPVPKTKSGPGKMPLKKTAYTLFQRMSAQDILASDLNQVWGCGGRDILSRLFIDIKLVIKLFDQFILVILGITGDRDNVFIFQNTVRNV